MDSANNAAEIVTNWEQWGAETDFSENSTAVNVSANNGASHLSGR
jgi:hypothetical protein